MGGGGDYPKLLSNRSSLNLITSYSLGVGVDNMEGTLLVQGLASFLTTVNAGRYRFYVEGGMGY